MISGWVFFGAALVVVAGGAGLCGPAGRAGEAEPEIPVEWWGVRRPWRPEDEEVLDRGVAGG